MTTQTTIITTIDLTAVELEAEIAKATKKVRDVALAWGKEFNRGHNANPATLAKLDDQLRCAKARVAALREAMRAAKRDTRDDENDEIAERDARASDSAPRRQSNYFAEARALGIRASCPVETTTRPLPARFMR